jgi:hypothetical protein
MAASVRQVGFKVGWNIEKRLSVCRVGIFGWHIWSKGMLAMGNKGLDRRFEEKMRIAGGR